MARKYAEFVRDIDLDEFYFDIGFEPTHSAKGNDVGKCPDLWGMHKHGDTTGKFAVHRDKRVYNCFVCGGGSLLSLVMEMYGFDIDAATDYLYRFTKGDNRSDSDFLSEIDDLLYQEKVHESHVLPPFNPKVIDKWLCDHPWFEHKGISVDVVISHKLGHDPDHLKRSPKKGEDDYHGPAIIIPHFWNGKLVGWQDRWLAPDDERPKWCAKYTNTSSFPKRFTLFNWDRVQDRRHPVLVFEGAPSALRIESLGLPAVATFGTSVTPEQLLMLRRCQQGVILATDRDGAGEKMRNAVGSYLERYLPTVRVIDNEVFNVPAEGNVADLEDEEILLEAVRRAPLFEPLAGT